MFDWFDKIRAKRKYMVASKARDIADAKNFENKAAAARVNSKIKFFDMENLDEEKFEKLVKKRTYKALKEVPYSSRLGIGVTAIEPKDIRVRKDDFELLDKAIEIVKDVVSPYGYEVTRYLSDTIFIKW